MTLTRCLFATWVEFPSFIFLVSYSWSSFPGLTYLVLSPLSWSELVYVELKFSVPGCKYQWWFWVSYIFPFDVQIQWGVTVVWSKMLFNCACQLLRSTCQLLCSLCSTCQLLRGAWSPMMKRASWPMAVDQSVRQLPWCRVYVPVRQNSLTDGETVHKSVTRGNNPAIPAWWPHGTPAVEASVGDYATGPIGSRLWGVSHNVELQWSLLLCTK